MNEYRKSQMILPPERKMIGWSYYNEKVTCKEKSPNLPGTGISSVATIRGKKLCIFGKFIWDYKIEVIDFKTHTFNLKEVISDKNTSINI